MTGDSKATADARAALAPDGVLRVALNMSNPLLVKAQPAPAEPTGIAPDMGRELARRLDARVEFVCYPSPGPLADDAGKGLWSVGLIAAEPQREAQIAFTSAYLEIEAGYLVPAGSPLQQVADVDSKGVRISVVEKSAFELWLSRNIKNAELVMTPGADASFDAFVEQKLDALSGLKPRLFADVKKLPGARVLDGRFMAVQQAIGTPRGNAAGTAGEDYLRAFVEDMKRTNTVTEIIARNKVVGVAQAAPAQSVSKAPATGAAS